jgi:AcrR family transcriptional regulator
MSSSDRRRRPSQEERELARQAGQAARQKAKEAANAAKAKAREAARDVAEAAREEALEAAFAARREAEAARGRMVGEDADGEHGPFGLLWQPEAPAARGGRGRGSGLNREQIVTAALRVAEAEGAEAVSMRRIAKELGVGTMSLYHHIPTKDDLLDLMTDQVMGELVLPEDALGDTWQEGLTAISRRTREVYNRHSWMLSGAWERPQFGPRAFAHIEQSLEVMKGVPKEQALVMLGVADDFVIGFTSRAIAERQALARAGMDQVQWQDALRPYVEGLLREHADDYPNLAQFVDAEWDQDEAERFERGLRWLIAGMAAELGSGA